MEKELRIKKQKLGKLVKPKYCALCGKKTKLQAHHDNYFMSLEVRWVCWKCHQAIHKLTPKTRQGGENETRK